MKDEYILTKNLNGWGKEDISTVITAEPKLTGDPDEVEKLDTDIKNELKAAFETTKQKRPNDFNGEKVSVKKIKRMDGKVKIFARKTDYFTLWGFPHAAPELFEKLTAEFIESKNTNMPNGLYAACMVITSDDKVIMNIISQQGFSGGKISFGFEEQTEVDDLDPIETAVRGLKEEFGIDVSDEKVKVLGFGKAFNMAYTSAYCIIDTDLASNWVIEARANAVDKNEASCLLAVPFADVGRFCSDEVSYELARSYLIDGKVDERASFVKHVANIPRWDLVKRWLRLHKRI